MLFIVGVIGVSLFVGFSVVIVEVGLVVLLVYLFVGLLVVMIMWMLVEMVVVMFDIGLFFIYVDKVIGCWVGYIIGWLYWWFWVLVILLEVNIVVMILYLWVSGIFIWLFFFVIIFVLIGSNLLSVKNYGEFEFWLVLCKVIVILVFIFFGVVVISGFYLYVEVSGILRLWDSGGFMFNGFGVVLSVMLIIMFLFMGVEIVIIVVVEFDMLEKYIVCVINLVIWCIFIFYLCFIFVVVVLILWNMFGLKVVGFYCLVLELFNIFYVKLIMDCVILFFVISCLNLVLYIVLRMFYFLSCCGDVFVVMGKINCSKILYVVVLFFIGVVFLMVVVNYYVFVKVFKFLIDSFGVIVLLVYLVIVVLQLWMCKIL